MLLKRGLSRSGWVVLVLGCVCVCDCEEFVSVVWQAVRVYIFN